MKWVLLACFLAGWSRCGGSAIRCTPGSPDGCSDESVDNAPLPPVEMTGDREDAPKAECLAGTEWDSNCHYCRCSDSGVAECLKQDTCDDGVFSAPIQCKPNTTFVRDCNTCVCLQNGLALCTIQYCRRSGIPKKSELRAGKQCAPGSTWKTSCSDCKCSESGYTVCDPTACEDSAKEPDMRCAPDTMWKNECNTCWCTSDGRAMCTKIGCGGLNQNFDLDIVAKDIIGPDQKKPENLPHKHYAIDGYDKKIEDEENKDKSNFEKEKVDSESSDLESSHSQVKRSVCKPNEEFEQECNQCHCSADGLHYTCTQNECLERDMNKEVEVFMENEGVDHIERHSVCKPSDTFYIGCNTCHCNDEGTDYSCTNKPCPLPEDVELFHELRITKSSTNSTREVICVANRMFIKDCNTCWCNDDGTSYFCTRKVCIPELPADVNIDEDKPEDLRTIIKECRPDEVFELDCNMCRCNPDGKSFSCTRRACVDQEDAKNSTLTRRIRATPQEAPKACQPGQEFRLDCNKCLCDNEGQDFSCTRIDCIALNNNNNGGGRSKRDTTEQIASECTPGSVFQQECNVCRCTNDGHHAMCSTNRCNEEPKTSNVDQHNDHSPGESDPGFRCNPGEQFKRSCNDCTCSADGKSYFCTLRLCDAFMASGV